MEFEKIIHGLNSLARTGWLIRGIPPSLAETVGQHVFASSLIALLVSEKLVEKGVEINII